MAGAQIQSLTWDLPSTTGAAIKRELERQRERDRKERLQQRTKYGILQ